MNEQDRPREAHALGLAAYYGTALVAGLIVGFSLLPYPVDVVVLLALALGATWIRYRIAGRDSFSSSISWLALFALVWLPVAWILGRFPFGS